MYFKFYKSKIPKVIYKKRNLNNFLYKKLKTFNFKILQELMRNVNQKS